jgi:hypothetical protein
VPNLVAYSEQDTAVVRTPDGKLLKVNPHYTTRQIREYVTARERMKGVPGTEQLHAASDKPGELYVLTHLVPGKTTGKLTEQEKQNIPTEHFRRLARTLKTMNAKNVQPDFLHAKNTIHNSGGIHVIDYETLEQHRREHAANEGWKAKKDQAPYKRPTAATNAFDFGDTVITDGLKDGSVLPDYAVRYYKVCRKEFGVAAAKKLLRSWAERYRLPPGMD